MPPDDRKPWHRLPGEPSRWFQRFERFRLLGPGRSMRKAWLAESPEGPKRSDVPNAWKVAVETWDWRARAEAWDQAEAKAWEESRKQQIDRRRRAVFAAEWSEASSMLEAAAALRAEALAMPGLGRTRRVMDSIHEAADGEQTPVKESVDRDALSMLETSRRLSESAITMARRAAVLATTIAPSPEVDDTHTETRRAEFVELLAGMDGRITVERVAEPTPGQDTGDAVARTVTMRDCIGDDMTSIG